MLRPINCAINGVNAMSKKSATVKYDQMFIIRCWEETPESRAGTAFWRYRVSHNNNVQQERHFSSLEDVQAYMQRTLCAAQSHSGNDDRL